MAASQALVSILLKLAAASLTGAIAFLAFRRHLRDEDLATVRRDIHAALLRMREDDAAEAAVAADPKDGAAAPPARRGPPVVVVIGFPAHGKSSLVNTACRALGGEGGPFLARAEAGPPGPTPGVTARRVFRVVVTDPDGGRKEGGKAAGDGEGEEEEVVPAVDLVDSPDLPDAGKMTRADVERTLSLASPAPECVVLVLRCAGPQRAALRRLPEIASVVREKGLHLVVVLTHKNALGTMKEAQELRKEVSTRVKSDSVYMMENYTASGKGFVSNPIAFKNNFNTHSNVLAIVRQCIEFAAMHRTHQNSSKAKKLSNKTLCIREE